MSEVIMLPFNYWIRQLNVSGYAIKITMKRLATKGNIINSTGVAIENATWINVLTKLCYCRSMESSYVEVESLSAFTSYKFRLLQCDGTKSLYNEFDIQTKHDSKFDELILYLYLSNHKLNLTNRTDLLNMNHFPNSSGSSDKS